MGFGGGGNVTFSVYIAIGDQGTSASRIGNSVVVCAQADFSSVCGKLLEGGGIF